MDAACRQDNCVKMQQIDNQYCFVLALVFSCVEAIVNQIVFVAGDFDAVAMACRFSRAIPDSWLGGMPIGLRGRDFWTAWKDEPFWTGFSLREAKWIKIESEIAGF